ncbi:MAG TPA: copper amine oxidase N-terminal domain-containing protein [Bacillus bacterium]|nr:copper amine oxidase N-terminal domain-containing protein [Bacillus sp. (in: firmicutes)]
MRKKIGILGLSASLLVGLAPNVSAAEIWSDGDWQLGQPANSGGTSEKTAPYTEIWSEPVKTEIWTEPVKTEIWSEPTETENGSKPIETEKWIEPSKTEIWSEPLQTQVQLTFTIMPVLEKGSVLVPLRGTLEQLGFSIEWRAKEQLAIIKKGDKTINLKANSNVATVNGTEVSLTSPAKLINGSVFVPLRFISTATGSDVNWDAATTKVTIDNKYYFYVDKSKQQMQQNPKEQATNSDFYVGAWKLWVPGGFANVDSSLNSDGSTTVTQEYVKGAGGKLLTIKADGTYTWDAIGGMIKGVWKAADNERILLQKGEHGYDWHVQKVNENEVKITAGYGLYTEGTRVK